MSIPEKLKEELKKALKQEAIDRGRKGGKSRAKKLSAKRRKEIAILAIKTRWAKK